MRECGIFSFLDVADDIFEADVVFVAFFKICSLPDGLVYLPDLFVPVGTFG